MRKSATMAALAAAVTLAACGGTDESVRPATTVPETTTTTEATFADDADVVPAVVPEGTEPGDLLALEPVAHPSGASAYRALYASQGVSSPLVPVSGVLFVPDGPAPEQGRPVVAWAHGTVGIADECAPGQGGAPFVPYLDDLLDAGYAVAATDYEGLGTPGTHPFLVGSSEGRSVIDSARSLADVPGFGPVGPVIALGHSQGGHAALFAGQIAPEYAPDLDLRGVAAVAPAGELTLLLGVASSIPEAFGFVALAAEGYAAAYPELDTRDVLTAEGAAAARQAADRGCLDEVRAEFAARPPSDWLAANPVDDPEWAARIDENTPGMHPVHVPVLVLQGTDDTTVPKVLADAVVSRLCATGTAVRMNVYDGAGHSTVLGPAREDVLSWAHARVAGEQADEGCVL